MDLDPDVIDLAGPLPGGALRARLEYRAERVGRDRTVPRSQATYAQLALEHFNRDGEERRLTLEQAQEFLDEARRLHARAAERDAASRERAEAARAQREAMLAAGVSLDCPRCGIPRAYEGRRDLLSAGVPQRVASTGDFADEMHPTTRAYHEYACPRCGSVEWFRHGPLEHPLP